MRKGPENHPEKAEGAEAAERRLLILVCKYLRRGHRRPRQALLVRPWLWRKGQELVPGKCRLGVRNTLCPGQ